VVGLARNRVSFYGYITAARETRLLQEAGFLVERTLDLKAVEKVRDTPLSERRRSLFTGYTRISPLGG
jgi:hypothetical protein